MFFKSHFQIHQDFRKSQNMGNFLSQIEHAEITIDKELLNISGSKLREYYSSYQSICENFSINIPQYVQIFGSNVRSFSVWDPYEMGCINAIEMFAGLIIFSQASYEEKVKFLYELFDLNEEGFLCYQNLVFMFVSICDATYKIYSIQDEKNEQEIQEFLMEYFYEESEVSYKDFIRWSYRISEFIDFFHIINHDFTPKVLTHSIDEYDSSFAISKREKEFQYKQSINSEFPLDQKYLTTLKNDNILVQEDVVEEEFNPNMKWVYGIRIDDIKEPIHYLQLKTQKAANDRIIYICGKNIVIFFPKLNAQQHYTRHKKAVSCVQISENNTIMASGQMGEDPTIHLWEIKSLKTITLIENIQKKSIFLMKFIKQDELLVTVGERADSPIIIVDIRSHEIVLSTYFEDSVLKLIRLQNGNFCVGLSKKLVLFEEKSNNFKITFHNNEGCAENAFFIKLSNSQIIIIDSKNEYKLWNIQINEFLPLSLEDEKQMLEWSITSVTSSKRKNYFYVLENNKIWVMKKDKYTIKVQFSRQVSENLFNLSIIEVLQISQTSFLVLSLMGDLIRIDDAFDQPIEKKYYQIFKMENVSAASLLDQSRLLIASSHFLYVVQQNQKQVISAQFFEQILTHVHSKKRYCVVATAQKYLIVLLDGIIQERTKISDIGSIQDVKMIDDCIIVANGINIMFYNKNGNDYFQKEPKRIKLQNTSPIHIGISSYSKIFLVITEEKNMFKVNPQVKEKNALPTAKQLYCNYLETFYPFGNALKIPILFSVNRKMFLCGKPNGEISFWNSLSHMISFPDLSSSLNGHSSEVNQLMMTQNGFISVGSTDGQLIIWQNSKPLIDQDSEEEDKNEQRQIKRVKKEKVSISESKTNQKVNLKKQKKIYSLHEEELRKFNKLKSIPFTLKDSKIEVVVKDINQYKDLNKIINKILKPRNQKIYEELMEKEKTQLKINIKFQYAFGFQTEKNKQSLFYIHHYQDRGQKYKMNINEIQSKNHKTGEIQTTKQFQFSHQTLLPLNEIHERCKREFIFFSGRLAIVSCPSTKKQRAYNFHRNQITCITVHPNKQIICTCEYGNPHPFIQIWNVNSMGLLHQLSTKHYKFIYRVEFSRDGKQIVSVGGPSGNNSIEIHNWENEESICFRLIENIEIYDLKVNPYNRDEIAICGKNLLQIYRISNRTLVSYERAKTKKNDILCLIYTSSIYGNTIQSDIITGNETGNLSLFICGKYVVCRSKAHEKSINCLKMCELFKYKTVLISAGEDHLIKLWDAKFNQIGRISIKDALTAQKSIYDVSKVSFSAQSLDIYHCCSAYEKDKIDTILLFGTRNGCILEAKISNEYQGLKMVSEDEKKQNMPEKITLNIMPHVNNFPSGGSYNFDIKGKYMITYSSTCVYLVLWNLDERQFIKHIKINSYPTVVKFSETNFIAVGTSEGKVQFYEMGESASIIAKEQRLLYNYDYYPSKIIFSQNDRKIAVCYQKSKELLQKEESMENGSVVYVYDKVFNSTKNQKLSHRISTQNRKYFIVDEIQFSSSGDKLILFYSDSNRLESTYKKANFQFVIYDINKKIEKQLTDQDFNELNFSIVVQAFYHQYSYLIAEKENPQNGHNIENKNIPVKITQMTQYDKSTIMGTSNGQIFLVKSDKFYTDFDYITERQQSTFAKLYTVSSNPIKNMQVVGDVLYISCEGSSGIFSYNLYKQAREQSQRLKDTTRNDPFCQKISTEKIQNKLKYIFPKRKNCYECQLNATVKDNEKVQDTIGLELKHIFGRTAFYKRNNIFIDLKGDIISFAGCKLVIVTKNHDQKTCKQDFLKIDNNIFSTNPEITAMTLSSDKHFLYVGTTQQNAQIIVWNISTRTELYHIVFKKVIEISHIKVSQHKRHAAILGINREGQRILMFINLAMKKILACYCFKEKDEIHDLEFVPNQQFKFLFCGNKIIGEASYEGHLLTLERYSLENPKDFIDLNQKAQVISSIIFYSLIFLHETAITAGSDGYLYLWHDKKIIKKQNAHPKAAILSLFTSKNAKIFVSGAADGKAIVWQLGSSSIFQKIFQFSIYSGKDPIIPPKYQIQSVCIGKNELILGTRSGQIHQFNCIPSEENSEVERSLKNKGDSTLLLSSFDDDMIVSCSFDISSQKLFVLTQEGVLSLFDLSKNEKLKEEKIDIDNSQIVNMLTCKLSNKLFIVLKNSIQVYQCISDIDKNSKPINKFKKCKEHLKSMSSEIKAGILSINEKYLAILIAPNQLQNAKIQVYDLTSPQNQFYSQYKVLQNIPANIEIIDFSTDNGYLVYKNSDQDETIIDLTTKQSINTDMIQFQLQWNEEAKKTSKYIRDICSTYSDENKLLKIAQIRNHSILATDEMGSVRVYKYQKSNEDNEITYERFYLQHLNEVFLCVLSSNCAILVTVGRYDRCIFIWKIKNFQKQKQQNEQLTLIKKQKPNRASMRRGRNSLRF